MSKKTEDDIYAKNPPPWALDGKRFVASLQKADELNCYKDFFDSNNSKDAQMMANNAAQRENRKAIVYDRYRMETIFTFDYTPKPELITPDPKPKKVQTRKIKRK